MTLFYEEEGALKLPFDCQALAREVINDALEYIHCHMKFRSISYSL